MISASPSVDKLLDKYTVFNILSIISIIYIIHLPPLACAQLFQIGLAKNQRL